MTLLEDVTRPQAASRAHDVVLRAMIDAAVRAPSAENTQPWRFCLRGNSLLVGLEPQGWLPSDVAGLLAMTGVGAAIENAVIAARAQGYEPRVHCLVPERLQRTSAVQPVAAISLTEGPAGDKRRDEQPLFSSIARRCTNRRLESAPIEPGTLARLGGQASSLPGVRIDWMTTPQQLRAVGQLVGWGNRLRFEHRPYQREFYDHIRFTRREVESLCDGLDVATLQIPWHARATLRALGNWTATRVANALGFSRLVAHQAALEVRSSGAVGILSIESPTSQAMLAGGRAFERLWLTAAHVGIGLHPTASLPAFLAHARTTGGASGLPRRQQALVDEMTDRAAALLPDVKGRCVQMAFRVGYAKPCPVRSLRRDWTELMFDCELSDPLPTGNCTLPACEEPCD
jgi:hypothetical protein